MANTSPGFCGFRLGFIGRRFACTAILGIVNGELCSRRHAPDLRMSRPSYGRDERGREVSPGEGGLAEAEDERVENDLAGADPLHISAVEALLEEREAPPFV